MVRSVLTKYVAMLRDYHVFSGQLSNLVFIRDIFKRMSTQSGSSAAWKGVSPTPEYRSGMCGITSLKDVDIHLLVTPVTHVNLIHKLYQGHDFIQCFLQGLTRRRWNVSGEKNLLIPLLPKRV